MQKTLIRFIVNLCSLIIVRTEESSLTHDVNSDYDSSVFACQEIARVKKDNEMLLRPVQNKQEGGMSIKGKSRKCIAMARKWPRLEKFSDNFVRRKI